MSNISFGNKNRGFTIVELLIVIVVIAILAAISIVAYNGIQQRGRDSQRASDVSSIQKALELYYIDNGQYPAGGGSTSINSSWTTTADASWSNLASALVPKYIASMPKDPISKQMPAVTFPWTDEKSYNYSYLSRSTGSCGLNGTYQGYLLVVNNEQKTEENTNLSSCSPNQVGPYAFSSNYYVLKK